MKFEIDDEAIAEADEAREYYATIRPELGADFMWELDRAMARIQSDPLMWPPYTGLTRRCLLSRFPYVVIYRVRSDALRVLAVAHQHRRPGYWQGR